MKLRLAMHLTLFVLFVLFLECRANLPPVFTLDMNNLAISETTSVGSVIYKLEGFDPENSTVHFDLKGTDILHVNKNSGVVTVVKPLDYETNDTLNVIVSISDEVTGGRNNNVEVPVTVIVLDENDNAPQFINAPYDVQVEENVEIGSTIFDAIQVVDGDTIGQNLEVQCTNLPDYYDACDHFEIRTVDSRQSGYQGALVLLRKLNYSVQEKHQFLLRASDGELDSVTNVTVSVGDVQDTPPRFTGAFSAAIEENATINTLVMTVHAEDGDRGRPRPISYELINNPMNYFILDAVSGELRTARPLDKEAVDNPEGVLILNVRAHELINDLRSPDPSTSALAALTVRILDVNDEPPAFNRRDYHVEIPENLPVGSALPLDMTVRDPDEGANAAFALRLRDISGAFAVAPATVNGSAPVAIRVAHASLDYEDPNRRKFIVLVVAEELRTRERLSSTATLTVTVTDVNDNAPTFDRAAYAAAVPEEAAGGALVAALAARDRDSGRFGEEGVLYGLAGSGSELFEVNNRTGAVTVRACAAVAGRAPCLDFEDVPVYHLQFSATDDDGKGRKSVVPLTVHLTDSNDNAPVFAQPIYRVFINEGAVRFEPELVVKASDADVTSHVTYSIVSGNAAQLFSIDAEVGKIRIVNNRGLNVSNETNEALVVMATDGKFTATTIVNITVLDVNNNAPLFEEDSYVEAVAEDVKVGYSVLQLKATDLDTGPNAEIEYQMQKGAYDDFQIDAKTGLVTVASKLDYDRRNTYNIEVIAHDFGEPSLTGTTTLTVNVINTNDKLPYFAPITQNAEVMEDAKLGSVIHTLIALDPDVNSSEALNFAATEPISAIDKHGNQVEDNAIYRDFFTVDKNTGQVVVSSRLERDLAAIVRITVLVTDTTAPGVQQGQGLLIITIRAINHSPPMFLPPWTVESPIYRLELKEELPVGTIVATYRAEDADSDIAGYSLLDPSGHFEINNGTGIVQIRRSIDYETEQALNFTISAFDVGTPQLSATATVLVEVVNLNDNEPVFDAATYSATVAENSPNGSFVARVRAVDRDRGAFGRVTYALTGAHSAHFAVDALTGVVSVADAAFLDREARNESVVGVVARDGGGGAAAAELRVAIADVNDNAPAFGAPAYNVSVAENVRLNPPMPLVQVEAVDADEGVNGQVHYRIVEGNVNDVFLLGIETGILYAHKSLQGEKSEFKLLVEARDGAGNGLLYDRAIINVQVLNVNEHKPMFTMPALPNSTVEITENAASEDYLVMTVRATDGDEHENGKVTYHLKVNDENVQETNEFSIDRNSGELRSRIFLDREEQSKYELVLVARDHGYPKWYETLRFLTILLVDINDNRPEFPDSKNTDPYHFYVTENNEVGLLIGQVKALDRDEGRHAKVYYHLLPTPDSAHFRVDRTTGSLYALARLDRETQPALHLQIAASNDPDPAAAPPAPSLAHVLVTVRDLNDNAPAFERRRYRAAVSAMAPLGHAVARVRALDPDEGANGSLAYYVRAARLYSGERAVGALLPAPFNVSEAGEVRTAAYLAENAHQRFVVEVVAREGAEPGREASAEVGVWVFEPEQLVRVILSRGVDEVRREVEEIVAELGNATQCLVIVDEIRFHTDDNGFKNEEWSDMYILVVDPITKTILPIPEVLKIIDSKYDFLKDYYAGFAIENVVPAFITEKEEAFDPALAALIALLIVLFVGIITFIIVCCCLKHWVISPSDLKKKDALIKKAIIDDLNTTENPLWIEQKLKIYEEQELTMQVFNEPEQNQRRHSEDFIPDDNTYATIQHPTRRGSAHMAGMLGDELADYATLGHAHDSAHSSLRGAPNYYEAALGFQGSTFQVPERILNANGECVDPFRFQGSELTINHPNQPEYVSELI